MTACQLDHDRTKVLFVSESVTLAHMVRPLVLAEHMRSCGHQVALACDNHYRWTASNSQVPLLSLSSRSPDEFLKILERGEVLFDSQVLQRYLAEDLRIIDQFGPDVLVADLRPSLQIAAKLRNLPLITLSNAYWSPFATDRVIPAPCLAMARRLGGWRARCLVKLLAMLNPFILPKVLAKQGAGLNELLQRFGQAPFSDYFEGFTAGDITLYADLPELVPLQDPPVSHRAIGPLLWSPQIALPQWWQQFQNSPEWIYVCMGSSGVPELGELAVRTLLKQGYTVVTATAGHALKLAPHARLFQAPYLPGQQLCAGAALVVCNGGSPMVYQALQAGVPVLGIASNMDQLLMMSYVQRAGVGRLLRADTSGAQDISSAVQLILNDTKLRSAARRVAAQISQCHPLLAFEQAVLELFKKRRGVYDSQQRRVQNM